MEVGAATYDIAVNMRRQNSCFFDSRRNTYIFHEGLRRLGSRRSNPLISPQQWLPQCFSWFAPLPALVLVHACASSTAGHGEVPDGADALPDGGGSGSISGSADGSPFTTVATSYVIGAPDSTATTVVFVFSKPVTCAELGQSGWDRRIANAAQFLEIKFFGNAPGTFTAVTTVTPAPGEASVNYTLSSTSGTPNEIGSSGGTATLMSITSGASATGSFVLKFGTNALNGAFNAVFCPGGHEP